MKIVLVCHDVPYPPIHGARVDAWRRIKAFAHFGVELQIISWCKEVPKPEEIAELQKYAKEVHLLPFNRTLAANFRRVVGLLNYPLEVTSRILRGSQLENILAFVRAFEPDVIWLDYLHAAELAFHIKNELNIPLLSRSQNIEYLYYRRLLASTIDAKSRLRRYFSVSHLEDYEKKVLQSSAFFYDISVDDLKFWQEQGFSNGRYLPPIVEFDCEQISKSQQDRYDVVFLGNLNVDNNVAGVVWFVTQVLPILRANIPQIKILIAGSNPIDKILQLCQERDDLDLCINPPSSSAVYNSGKVLINPVPTGSGVSIKSVEMLMSGKAIVSRPQGIAGLPQELKSYFNIAEDAESFATAIIKLLSTSNRASVEPELLKSLFGFEVVKRVISDIESLSKSQVGV
jgi:glycosyltransferase involved in cell wall biosynthesis